MSERNDTLRKLMVDGVFGKVVDDGYFVVVNNLAVYEDGGFDYLEDLINETIFKVEFLVSGCQSFNQIKNIPSSCKIIYTINSEVNNTEETDADGVKSAIKDLQRTMEDGAKRFRDKGLSEKQADDLTKKILGMALMAVLEDISDII